MIFNKRIIKKRFNLNNIINKSLNKTNNKYKFNNTNQKNIFKHNNKN